MKLLPSRWRCFLFPGLLAGGLFGPDQVRAVVIDDFSQGAFTQQATNIAGVTTVLSGLNPAAVLGGARSGYAGSLRVADESVDTDKGRFNFKATQDYGYFTLTWGSVLPLHADLRAGGNDRFRFEWVDTLPVPTLGIFELRVQSGGQWFLTDIHADLVSALQGQSFGVMEIPFARFAGANFAAVDGIALEGARVPAGMHLGLDLISTVPEPTVPALVGVTAGIGLWLRRRAGQPEPRA